MLASLALTGCLISHAGCATWQKTHESAVASFGKSDLSAARTALEKSHQSLRSEKKVLELDQAILELASGNVMQAETRFRTLRRELEHFEQKALSEQAQSMMTDSRAVAFSGRDFERRMVLNMALLTSLLGDGQDSFAYSLQVTEVAAKRKEAIAAAAKKATGNDGNTVPNTGRDPNTGVARLADPPETTSAVIPVSHSGTTVRNLIAPTLDQPLALSAYLAAAVQSENATRSRETEQALEDISFWNPAFRRHDETVSSGDFGTRCQPGHGTLHVISLVGKAPRWVNESAEPTSTALLIADRIISVAGKHTLPPTIASVKIARPEICGNVLPAGSLRCTVSPAETEGVSDGEIRNSSDHFSLTFSTVVNLNEVAQASYQEHRDEEIGAAIARRVMKKGAVYVLKETQQIHRNSLVDLGINVAGIAWEAMEQADTRSWRMLPARIDIARTELPVGEWKTQLKIPGHASMQPAQTVPVHIEDGRNTFVVCIVPENRLTGHILVGGGDQKAVPVDERSAAPESM